MKQDPHLGSAYDSQSVLHPLTLIKLFHMIGRQREDSI